MRTIDADAALKALRKCQTYLYDARDPELKIELSSAEAAINNLPTIQPVETDTNVGSCSEIPNSSDAINRQDAIDALDKRFDNIPMEQTAEILMLRKDLKALRTIQPERKKGKWIYNSPVTMKCDQCGLVIKDWDWHRFKICPNCGADMRGEKDG